MTFDIVFRLILMPAVGLAALVYLVCEVNGLLREMLEEGW